MDQSTCYKCKCTLPHTNICETTNDDLLVTSADSTQNNNHDIETCLYNLNLEELRESSSDLVIAGSFISTENVNSNIAKTDNSSDNLSFSKIDDFSLDDRLVSGIKLFTSSPKKLNRKVFFASDSSFEIISDISLEESKEIPSTSNNNTDTKFDETVDSVTQNLTSSSNATMIVHDDTSSEESEKLPENVLHSDLTNSWPINLPCDDINSIASNISGNLTSFNNKLKTLENIVGAVGSIAEINIQEHDINTVDSAINFEATRFSNFKPDEESCEIIIYGVPNIRNEYLLDTLFLISCALDIYTFSPDDVDRVTRFDNNSNSWPISITFVSSAKKDEWIEAIRYERNFTATDILNFWPPNKVYLSELATISQIRQANELKKWGFYNIYLYDGKLYWKLNKVITQFDLKSEKM